MRIVRTYLRIAPTSRGHKVQASARRSDEPLRAGYNALPTIQIALKLKLPDDAWNLPTAEAEVDPRAISAIEVAVEEAA